MIYLSGDKHGDYLQIAQFCDKFHTTKDDLMIILGDNGANYYGRQKDRRIHHKLEKLPLTFMMIRGNHDMRPSHEQFQKTFVDRKEFGGQFYIDPQFPSLMFTKEYGQYRLYDKSAFVICGAYSVDKNYRLDMYDQGYHQYRWFRDEQLSSLEMGMAQTIMHIAGGYDYILSHTCPYKYIPRDTFLPGIDQSTVDDSMEHWLDGIDETVPYQKWFCGHWHIDRTIDKIRFMYHDIIALE